MPFITPKEKHKWKEDQYFDLIKSKYPNHQFIFFSLIPWIHLSPTIIKTQENN